MKEWRKECKWAKMIKQRYGIKVYIHLIYIVCIELYKSYLKWIPVAHCFWYSGTHTHNSEVWEEILWTAGCEGTAGCVCLLQIDKKVGQNIWGTRWSNSSLWHFSTIKKTLFTILAFRMFYPRAIPDKMINCFLLQMYHFSLEDIYLSVFR